MRVLMISKSLPHTYKGGIQTHVWELSQSLLQRGHEVSILTAGSLKKGARTWEDQGVRIYEIPYLPARLLPVLSNTLSELSFNLAAVRWVEKNAARFDVVHVHGRSGYLYPGPGKRKLPVVTTVHRLYSLEIPWSKGEYKNPLDRYLHLKLATRLEKRAADHSDAVIAISQEVVNELESIQAATNNLRLIYNGINTRIPVQAGAPQGKQLLFVGRLSTIKGIYPLVESMLWVQPDIRLKMIGGGPEARNLQKRIAELGLGDRIELTGVLPIGEVFHHLEQSFALVLPSFHESQGIVLMEANLAGKPTLGANVPGINEMILPGKNGYLFPPGDPAAMAEAINALFSQPRKAAELGAWGRNWVISQYSWKKIAREVESVYTRLTDSAGFDRPSQAQVA
ncbi:MAG: glycosyltransferase family 4 protein [Haliscomenobacter sp.]|nr:glycosyltransferase family 4 protein [Haliscomenobacter sp.]MBP9076562.1 glycosyltransferase family 4 protein [Haliscomenobacter sp.]MBP9873246.1 glycosyltransferase family 4 protein [Haliscomenobacter sp.]